MKLVERTLEAAMVQRPEPTAYQPQNMCLDKGYDYPEVRKLVAAWGYTGHIKSRGEEQAEKRSIPGYRARRWIVERTHSWLNRFRRLLIRWEKKKWRTMWLCFISLAPGLLSAPARLLDRLLVGVIPTQLGNLANLRSLDLFRNQLTGPIPPQLAILPNLRFLDLEGNRLTGPIPSSTRKPRQPGISVAP